MHNFSIQYIQKDPSIHLTNANEYRRRNNQFVHESIYFFVLFLNRILVWVERLWLCASVCTGTSFYIAIWIGFQCLSTFGSDFKLWNRVFGGAQYNKIKIDVFYMCALFINIFYRFSCQVLIVKHFLTYYFWTEQM